MSNSASAPPTSVLPHLQGTWAEIVEAHDLPKAMGAAKVLLKARLGVGSFHHGPGKLITSSGTELGVTVLGVPHISYNSAADREPGTVFVNIQGTTVTEASQYQWITQE